MLRPSKRGWFVTFALWACGVIAVALLSACHALFDEQLV
jgi:hypothetical protein